MGTETNPSNTFGDEIKVLGLRYTDGKNLMQYTVAKQKSKKTSIISIADEKDESNDKSNIITPKEESSKEKIIAKEIISERVQGLDLAPHPTKYKQLSSKRMKKLREKKNNRTLTKEEYKLYKWNERISKRRNEGVKEFWNQERERILAGKKPTRNWTKEQEKDILSGKIPTYKGKKIRGHHSYSVSQYPHLANKGEVIYPATEHEHLNGWHARSYKKSLPGEPIINIVDF